MLPGPHAPDDRIAPAARRAGFTLIELLVVVAIVAVLAGLLMPALSLVRAAARSTQCTSNLRQITMAAECYSADWEGFRVPVYTPGDAGPSNAVRHWGGFLQGYLGCDPARTVLAAASDLRPLICPESPKRFGFGGNMSCNGLWNAANPTWGNFVHISSVRRPSEKVAFVDSIAAAQGQITCGNVPTDSFSCWRGYVNSGATSPPAFTVNFIHRRRANVAWVDGHVSTMGSGDGLVKAGDPVCDDQWWKRQ